MDSSAFIDFFSGLAGATASVYVGQPLDTIKTKLQTFPGQYRNFIDCAQQIFGRDGIRGLYAGTIPSLMANAAENGVLFLAYGQCQKLICTINEKTDQHQLTSVENMAAGGLAASFASLALCPTELVKCRLQTLHEVVSDQTSSSQQKVSALDLTKSIFNREGIRGFYRGLSATLARECPGYACFFGAYETTRSLLAVENQSKTDIGILKTWFSGGMAGICFWIFMFPIDSLKSRIQVLKPNKTIIDYTIHILRHEGIRPLYSGLLPTLIRTFFATGALFITYETVQKFLREQFQI